ncbi:MAG TPA: M67 family metallopeptidase [Candidatus Sulfomarinibacteraceae bacterium]|nr:M67 family metallopeptidase [Candidatus Sulfomarinibacteraceae bacterium]
MLKVPADLMAEINAHGAATYPYEGCGVLLGRNDGGDNVVAGIVPVENNWEVEEERRVRFQITPEDMLKAELLAMRRGLDVVGIFHSHPDDEPVASQRDLAWATWPGYSYLITEVRQGQPGASRSWQLRPDRSGFVEEDMTVLEKRSK